jgi:tubulin--tyrosine ligase-like protein 12
MDELGSSIQHSDIPNVKVMPLLYLPSGTLDSAISYSIMWPTKNIAKGNPIFRDYLIGIDESKFRSCRLSVWYDIPFEIFNNTNSEY